jgi:hypothetical protein
METDVEPYAEQYRAAIEWERKRIGDRWLERNVGDVADAELPAFHARMGAGFRRIGIYALLLDDRETAREWFEKSAAHYVTSVRERRARDVPVTDNEVPELLLEATYAAVLSHNWELMGVAAREGRGADADGEGDRSAALRCGYARVGFLAALLTGRDAGARLARLEAAIEDLSPEVRSYYEPYADVFRGLANADGPAVSRGLREMLDLHDEGFDGKPTQPRELVCYPAAALTRLALDRGLDVAIESEYLPVERGV